VGQVIVPQFLASADAAVGVPVSHLTRGLAGDDVISARSSLREARVRGMVDRYLDFVARVLRNAGTPATEIEDDVQRTFIAVARRLDDVRPGAEAKFLLQVALRVAAHSRRTLARRREVSGDQIPESVDSLATPDQLTDQKRARQMLDRALGEMKPVLRSVFILFEFEQLNLGEIASVLGIPRGTVASRLRRARIEFRRRVFAFKGLVKARVES
jgi:RNA polymerase sigma-70 factor, ECF subfamily